LRKEENASVEIKWSKTALTQFAEILDFIVENGFGSYAVELEDRIIVKLDALIENKELYPPDRFKRIMMVHGGLLRLITTVCHTNSSNHIST